MTMIDRHSVAPVACHGFAYISHGLSFEEQHPSPSYVSVLNGGISYEKNYCFRPNFCFLDDLDDLGDLHPVPDRVHLRALGLGGGGVRGGR